ncbi:MAG: glycosyltransferase [Nitrospirae bacterium]|nr:glycosyltransferase [Nitrospirota bacterium]
MEKPKISLIIPAYNEEKFIGKTLDSVQKAKSVCKYRSLVEIIVVNNCSTDDTEKIARSFDAQVVLEKERCIASVRNRGAQVAEGEIIGFLDADSCITPNMFNSIENAMSSNEYIGGGTNIKIDRRSLGISCTYCITTYPARWLLGVAGGLIFTEKKTFQEMGGFDESLYCAEDIKFVLDLKRYGKRKGKKFKIITNDYITSSARSFDRFGDWFYFKNLPRILFNMKSVFKEKEFAKKYWYNVER